jgi:hypothetical protein
VLNVEDVDPAAITEAALSASSALAAAERWPQVLNDTDQALSARFGRVVLENADSIVEALRPHFDKALSDLKAAVDVLPEDVTAERVLTMGHAAMVASRTPPNGSRLSPACG